MFSFLLVGEKNALWYILAIPSFEILTSTIKGNPLLGCLRIAPMVNVCFSAFKLDQFACSRQSSCHIAEEGVSGVATETTLLMNRQVKFALLKKILTKCPRIYCVALQA